MHGTLIPLLRQGPSIYWESPIASTTSYGSAHLCFPTNPGAWRLRSGRLFCQLPKGRKTAAKLQFARQQRAHPVLVRACRGLGLDLALNLLQLLFCPAQAEHIEAAFRFIPIGIHSALECDLEEQTPV